MFTFESSNFVLSLLSPAIISETYFVKYARVHYDPMTDEEAKKCLQLFPLGVTH